MTPDTIRIKELNDLLRTTFLTGRVILTEGVAALSDEDRSAIVEAVQTFDTFTPDNDPHEEHDFGIIRLDGIPTVYWKIDYYDPSYQLLSEDPADPRKTRRVLTILLASEY